MLTYVFITCDTRRGLHVGVTLSLVQTLYLSKVASEEDGQEPVFDRLVYFEKCTNICHAYRRTQELESESQDSLYQLVEAHNPKWIDLSEVWFPLPSKAVVSVKVPERTH